MYKKLIWNFIIIIILVYYAQIYYVEWSRPVITTKKGRIRGVVSPEGYHMYLGIPYAKVREENPFGSSVPYPNFNDTFDASDDTKMCPQIEEVLQAPTGSLDCLNLHIYTPKLSKNLPVMVFFFGGQYRFGHPARSGKISLYEPNFLIRHDVIVVKFNFRNGIYGFLCLDTPEVPGNQGLKDQTLALRWVKENIADFGGNPNKITLFGHSSGAMSADFHLYVNPDLFQQVILQSGSALIPGGFFEANTHLPFEIAKKLGYDADNLNDALEFIKNSDIHAVVNQTNKVLFRPCIEKKFNGVEPFLTQYPINMKLNMKGKRAIVGNTKNEYVPQICERYHFLNREDMFMKNLKLHFDIDDDEILNEVQHFYIGDNEMSEQFQEEGLQFLNDLYFNFPTFRTIEKYSGSGADKIYQYIFSYDGKRNMMKTIKNITTKHIVHGDTLGYVFDFSFFNKNNILKEDQRIIDTVTTMWTNFAKFGDPTVEQNELISIKWHPTTKEHKQHLIIDSVLKMDNKMFRENMMFWADFYEDYEDFIIQKED